MTFESQLISLAEAIGADIKLINEKLDTYIYDQTTPSATWVIQHNLQKYPSVEVVDSAGTVVEGGISYDNDNQITITFVGAFSGKAYLN